ncbi:prepilin-type N-terminal cleavage/methylation domain-containing protein [Oleiagrimonas citrea]|uniref:Prepilin-type N-terminal cleavage/methylation domain-containing protein n=2 Tax=Oleiagrimonas citrea TaxID=1665687 RepID=A0A846ZJQ7_9GAMM|nr:PilW family protein [Oleiagrimonas citrea]NKZ37770.1 prepilin-type N-terminal cleavage/methylation domain-containing protein [Oleiagrimonas citrea]
MPARKTSFARASGRERGFSLVELMIAMVLGLVVIAGAGSVFLASSRTYQTNQALSDVQTNARVAFELLARDIRNAGQTACNNNGRVANVLNDKSTDWFANWGNALRGYDPNTVDPAVTTGTAVQQRVASTSSLQILGSGSTGLSVASHNPTSAQFKLNNATSDLKTGDVIIVCDPDHAAITQITNYNDSNVTLVHNTGTGSPGNCSKGLGFPTTCTANGNSYAFPPNSVIAKLVASDWYIGNNPEGGHSLYYMRMTNVSGTPTGQPQEMVRNVDDMQITFHQPPNSDFVNAASVTNWSMVDAVRVHLKLESTDQRAGVDTKALTREFTSTTTVRNRVK